MTRALIYARVSSDPDAKQRSVSEQERECRRVCEREGWDVVEVLTDNDVSASRYAKARRTAWPQVEERIAAGKVDMIVTWEASRAQRDLAAYTTLRTLCRTHGVRWSYDGKIYDMTDPDDSRRSAQDAVDAEYESERTAKRVRRAMRANADAGRPHGRLLWGYRRRYDASTRELVAQEPDPEVAPIIREMAARFLSGESARAIANDLNIRQVPTPRQGRWDLSRVRRVLVNPHYAALRVHNGQVVGQAAWPPILDRETHDRLVARFEDPSRRTMRDNPTANLLTGVARCGLCGGPMGYAKDRRHRRTYVCKRELHLTRDGAALDAHVTAAVLERLARPDAQEATSPTARPPEAAAALDEATELRRRLDDAVAEFTAGRLSASTLARVEADILPRIDAASRAARVAGMPTAVADVVGATDPGAAWDTLSVEQRRAVVRALLTVTVMPTRPGVRTFNPGAIRLEWIR